MDHGIDQLTSEFFTWDLNYKVNVNINIQYEIEGSDLYFHEYMLAMALAKRIPIIKNQQKKV